MATENADTNLLNSGNKSPNGPSPSPRKKAKSSTDKKIAEDEFMAAAIGDVEWLKQSLRGSRGVINYDKNGLSPIHLASIHGRVDCLKLLAEKQKVDVDLASKTGWRPLHLCISNQTGKRAFQCLLYLLERGANPSICNDDKITPVHQAASEGHVQCIKALLEVGAQIDTRDCRGHKPIDLAKLWGHRKCARILAAASWHQSKEFLAKEMKQLQKLQMQRALDGIAADEENKADQQFYGDLAFKDWLEKRGLSKDSEEMNNAQTEKKDKTSKSKKSGENQAKVKLVPQQESLSKANSFRPAKPPSPIQEETSSTSHSQRRVQVVSRKSEDSRSYTPRTKGSSESGDGWYEKPEGAPTTGDLQPVEQTDQSSMIHPHDWTKSTFIPEKHYVPSLPDHYPRDEYTKLPKYPPKRMSRSPTLLMGENVKSGSASSMRMPRLPQDVINKKLEPHKYERPVVYKCKHISDVHQKFHPDLTNLPKHEAGMHLTNDPKSLLFRNALVFRTTGTASTALSGVSQWSDDFKKSSYSLDGVMNLMESIGRIETFSETQGDLYDLTHGQVAAI